MVPEGWGWAASQAALATRFPVAAQVSRVHRPQPCPLSAPPAPSTQTALFGPPSHSEATRVPAPCPRKFPSPGGAPEWSHRSRARPRPLRPVEPGESLPDVGTAGLGEDPPEPQRAGAGVQGRLPTASTSLLGLEDALRRTGAGSWGPSRGGPPASLHPRPPRAHLAASAPNYLTPLSLGPSGQLCPVCACVYCQDMCPEGPQLQGLRAPLREPAG